MAYSNAPMFRTMNRIIGTAMNRYPAVASARRARGVPLGVDVSVLPRARLATPASLEEEIATTVSPAGGYWFRALSIAALVFSTTGAASKLFFWTWLVNSSWNAFWTSL